MDVTEMKRVCEFVDTFIKDDIIKQIDKRKSCIDYWYIDSQKIYTFNTKNILSIFEKITCVEFLHSTDQSKTKVDILIRITNPELLFKILDRDKNLPREEISKLIEITLKRIGDYKEQQYTYKTDTFIEDIINYINKTQIIL
jgi:hypothetical protein